MAQYIIPPLPPTYIIPPLPPAYTIPPLPVLTPELINGLLTREHMHTYQANAQIHQMTCPKSMLWLSTGIGKSIITLTTILDRLNANQIDRVLVVAPVRVLFSVWDNIESKKWNHTKDLRADVIHGTEMKRIQVLTGSKADILCINPELMNWLTTYLLKYYIAKGKPLPFQMIVYDEITKFKNAKSARYDGSKRERETVVATAEEIKELTRDWTEIYTERGLYINQDKELVRSEIIIKKGWKELSHMFEYRTGLTGTPAPNGYLDLFGQYLVLDDGKRLGEYITHYKNQYFTSDYMGYEFTISKTQQEHIADAISDITVNMEAKDYLDLPDVTTNVIHIDMPKKALKHYKELERELFTELESGTTVELMSKSALGNKCLQVCNGSIYTHNAAEGEESKWELVHDDKLDALESILEEAGGNPVFLAYNYRPDAERIMKKFKKKYGAVNLTAEKASKTANIIKRWKEGKIKLMIAHPDSAAHGIDGIQDSCNILVWFGVNWSLELFEQFNGRVDRQGQKRKVFLHILIMADTYDQIVYDVVIEKGFTQSNLRTAINNCKER